MKKSKYKLSDVADGMMKVADVAVAGLSLLHPVNLIFAGISVIKNLQDKEEVSEEELEEQHPQQQAQNIIDDGAGIGSMQPSAPFSSPQEEQQIYDDYLLALNLQSEL